MRRWGSLAAGFLLPIPLLIGLGLFVHYHNNKAPRHGLVGGSVVFNGGGSNFPGPTTSGGGGTSTTPPLTAVCAVAVTNITLSGTQTIDGQSAGIGTCLRILAVGETDPTTDGIYTAGSGAWTRTSDFLTASQMLAGAVIPVISGTTYGGTQWTFATTTPITVGSTALTFTQDPGGGALAGQTLAQARLTLSPQCFQSITGSNGQLLNCTGLNGNVDGDYDLYAEIVCTHTGTIYNFQPNSVTTNQLGWIENFAAGGTNGSGCSAYGINTSYEAALTSGNIVTWNGTLRMKTGRIRSIHLQGISNISGQAGNGMGLMFSDCNWTDTTTNLTNFAMVSSQTDGMGVGSFLQLTAKGQ